MRDKRIYKITCGNANSILSNRIINTAYQNYTITDIVTALFNDYISAEGIALGAISDIAVTMEVYTAKDYNLQNALNELAELCGATWTITGDREFFFIAEEDFPEFPMIIGNEFLDFADIQHKCTDYKSRTVQIVSGATDYTTPQDEVYTYNGEQREFTLVFPVAKKPEIYVNNVQLSPDRIGVKGMDDDDQNVVFFFSYSSENISYNELSHYLTTGNNVKFRYTGIFPIRVTAYNQSRIAEIAEATGTSGLREQVELDKSIVTRADALQLAESLLSRFSEQTEEITFWLLSSELEAHGLSMSNTAVLTVVEIELPQIGIQGRYVITERRIEPFSADLTSDYKITLKLMNRDYLRSYGETISDLKRGLHQLSIREDDIVIDTHTVDEIVTLSENLVHGVGVITSYPVEAGSTNIFTPLPLNESTYPE